MGTGERAVQDPPDVPGADPAQAVVDEDGRPCLGQVADVRPAICQPTGEGVDRRLSHRHAALLRALAPYRQVPRLDVHPIEVEPTQLAHAETAAIEQLEDRVVPQAPRRRLRVEGNAVGLQQIVELRWGERTREASFAGRRGEAASGVRLDLAGPL